MFATEGGAAIQFGVNIEDSEILLLKRKTEKVKSRKATEGERNARKIKERRSRAKFVVMSRDCQISGF